MELDLRKQRILQAIVQDYVATAEPVGSQVLVERYSLGVKSATIRNEMAEMSERGYLRQPHTSAGRVPSDLGYRFYVNRLMPLPVIQEGEAVTIRGAVATASSELDAILRRTCQLLTTMTRLPAVATTPENARETQLRQVFVSPAGADKTLLVLLFSTGRTANRVLSEANITASGALTLANALNDLFAGRSLSEPGSDSVNKGTEPPADIRRQYGALWPRLVAEVTETVKAIASEEAPVYVEGASAVLELPEFRDADRLGQLLSTLQERAAVLEMLGRAFGAAPNGAAPASVQVAIGEEMGRSDLAPYAVVMSPYFIGDNERGAIGVLGPTRMDYARASASVAFMAQTMGDLLTRLRFD